MIPCASIGCFYRQYNFAKFNILLWCRDHNRAVCAIKLKERKKTMQIPKNKTSIAIALILMFALVVSAIPAMPFVNAQTPSTWNISIAVTNTTGLVRIEVRYGSVRNQTTYTGIKFWFLFFPPAGGGGCVGCL